MDYDQKAIVIIHKLWGKQGIPTIVVADALREAHRAGLVEAERVCRALAAQPPDPSLVQGALACAASLHGMTEAR